MMRSNAVDLVSQLMAANRKILADLPTFLPSFRLCISIPKFDTQTPPRRSLYIMRCFNARSLVSLSLLGTFLSSLVNGQLTVQANNQGTPYLSAHFPVSEQ